MLERFVRFPTSMRRVYNIVCGGKLVPISWRSCDRSVNTNTFMYRFIEIALYLNSAILLMNSWSGRRNSTVHSMRIPRKHWFPVELRSIPEGNSSDFSRSQRNIVFTYSGLTPPHSVKAGRGKSAWYSYLLRTKHIVTPSRDCCVQSWVNIMVPCDVERTSRNRLVLLTNPLQTLVLRLYRVHHDVVLYTTSMLTTLNHVPTRTQMPLIDSSQ